MREIEKALLFAKRTVNDLVVVLARPSLRIAPKINPDKSGARSTPTSLSCFSGHNSPPARERAHNSHTRAVKIKLNRGSRGVLLIRGIQ